MWWQQAKWAIETQAREDTERLDQMTFALHCATVASGADPRDAWKAAVNIYDASRYRSRPWEPPVDRSPKQLENMWKDIFGDPDSDETKAAIDKTVEALIGQEKP